MKKDKRVAAAVRLFVLYGKQRHPNKLNGKKDEEEDVPNLYETVNKQISYNEEKAPDAASLRPNFAVAPLVTPQFTSALTNFLNSVATTVTNVLNNLATSLQNNPVLTALLLASLSLLALHVLLYHPRGYHHGGKRAWKRMDTNIGYGIYDREYHLQKLAELLDEYNRRISKLWLL